MEWYWWVLIIIGIGGIGFLKWWVAGKMRANRKKSEEIRKNNEKEE